MFTQHAIERFKALDALRGVAALFVVLMHFYQAIPLDVRNTLGQVNTIIWNLALLSRFSVVLFFVLSGFVLSLPYWAKTNSPYLGYAVKRFVRLYLPFAFAALLAALLCYATAGYPIAPQFDDEWGTPVTARALRSALFMFGVEQPHFRLDAPMWSLIVEMRVSLAFPFLMLIVARFRWVAVACGVLFAFACSKLYAARGGTNDLMANDIIGSLLLTGRYTALFLFGIMLGSKLEDVRLKLRALPLPLHLGLCIAGAAIHVFMAAHNLIGHGYGDVLEGIFAVYLIGCCVSFPRTEAHMSGRVPQWLGDISYSLYLIHLPVLLGVLYLLNSHLPFAVNMAVAIPAMFASAHLMHVYVEKPSIVIARALAPSR